MRREIRAQARIDRLLILAARILESLELSKIPGTFSNYLLNNVFYKVKSMTAQELEDAMLQGLTGVSSKVSEVAKKRFADVIKSMSGDKNRLIRYLTDIVLKGDELGMQRGLLPTDR